MRKSLAMLLTIAMLMNLAITVGFTVSAATEGTDEFNFATDGNRQGWTAVFATGGGTVSGGFLNANTTNAAPYLLKTGLSISGSAYNTVRVGLKYNGIITGSVPKIDFIRSAPINDGSTLDPVNRRVTAAPLTTATENNVVEITFNMSSNSLWNAGTIKQLNIYPFDAVANTTTYSVDYIKFMNIATYTITYNANAGSDAVLNLPTPASALSGSSFTLNPAATILRRNYNFLGWSKTADNSSGLITSLIPDANTTVYAIWELKSPLATSWNFESDASGWTTTDAAGTVAGGLYTIDASGTTGSAVSPADLCIDSSKYKIIKVGMVHKNIGLGASEKPKLWFKTSVSNVWSDTKVVSADAAYGSVSGTDIQEYAFDMSSSLDWTGIVEQIQLPFATAGQYNIDYIRVYKSASDDDNIKLSFNVGSNATILTHVPYSISAPTGSAVTLPTNAGFYRTGYQFKGWALAPNSTQALADYTMPAMNTTLYAVWAVKTTTGVNAVITPANGATNVYPADLSVKFKFESPMNVSTLTAANFSSTYFQKVAYDAATNTATCYFKPEVSYYGATISFTPSSSILSLENEGYNATPYSIKVASTYQNNGLNFIPNGNFEDVNNVTMFGVSGLKIQNDVTENSNVLYVPGSVGGSGYTQPKIKVSLKPSTKYDISYKVRVLQTTNGVDVTSVSIPCNIYYSAANHVSISATLGTADGWKTATGQYTTTADPITGDAELWFYSNPFSVLGTPTGVNYLLDDLSIVEIPTVTFKGGYNATGVSPTGFTGNYANGVEITLPDNTYSKEHYTFDCWTDDKGKRVLPGEKYIISGSPVFTATWVPEPGYNLYTATFNANGATGTVPDSISLLSKDGSQEPLVLPGQGSLAKTGYRYKGWGDSATATIPTTDTSLSANKTYYAIWELMESWTFPTTEGTQNWTVSNAQNLAAIDGALTFTMNNSTDPFVSSPALRLPAAKYGKIEITYKVNQLNETNYTSPTLFFTTIVNGVSTGGWAAERSFGSNPRPTVAGADTVLTIDTSKSTAWTGVISGIRFDPFDIRVAEAVGPVLSITSIKFILNTEINEELITTLDAPETKATPTVATVEAAKNYKVAKTEWIPTPNKNKFSGDTVYTAKVTLLPKAGFRFSEELNVITFNGVSKGATKNEDGSLTATYTFDRTAPLSETAVEIVAPYTEIKKNNGVIQFSAKVTSPQLLDDYTVVWTLDNPFVATIDAKGRLVSKNDGTVHVTATSVYDETKSDTITITVTNQSPVYTLVYNQNTTDAVTGMPTSDTSAKGDAYPLSTVKPARTGYKFIGWSTNIYGTKIYTAIDVKSNMDLYAVWASVPYGWEFATNAGSWAAGAQNGGFSVANGVLTTVSTGTDPTCTVGGLDTMFPDLDLNVYKAVEISMTHDFTTATSSGMQLFFKTDTWNGDWEANSLKATINGQSSNGQFIVYTLNAATNNGWNGKLNYFRFDPANAAGTFKIDYIRFVKATSNISFNDNAGGIGVTNMPNAASYKVGEVTLNGLPTPMRAGYKFMGWGITSTATPEYAMTSVYLVNDTTLYAIWQPGWSFLTVGDFEGWWSTKVKEAVLDEDGKAVLDAKGNTVYKEPIDYKLEALYTNLHGIYTNEEMKPTLYSPVIDVDPMVLNTVRFSMMHSITKLPVGETKYYAKIYFLHEGDADFTEANSVKVNGIRQSSNNSFFDYSVDMNLVPTWATNKKITRICIVPFVGQGDFKITDIGIVSAAPGNTIVATPVLASNTVYLFNTFDKITELMNQNKPQGKSTDKAWNFNDTKSPTEGWAGANLNGFKGDGKNLVGSAKVKPDGSYDPLVTTPAKLNLNVAAKNYKYVVVSMCYKVEKDAEAQLFYITDTQPLAETASVRYKLPKKDTEGMFEIIVFDMTDKWSGTLQQLRLDPFSCGGDFKINYVLITDEKPDNAGKFVGTKGGSTSVGPTVPTPATPAAPVVAVPTAWEFNDGQLGKVTAGNCESGTVVKDGFLTAKSKASDSGKFDPIVYIPAEGLDTSKYSKITVALKWDAASDVQGMKPCIFFTTDVDPTWTATKNVTASKTLGTNKSDTVVEYEFDCSSNGLWMGNIKGLRFDPCDGDLTFSIDYIRIS